TIHSFCATLLRQNAVEAGLDPRFDVLEDVLAVTLETEALVGSLQRLLTAPGQHGDGPPGLGLPYGGRCGNRPGRPPPPSGGPRRRRRHGSGSRPRRSRSTGGGTRAPSCCRATSTT